MTMGKFDDPAVEAIFKNWDAVTRSTGLRLRQLIFDTAAKKPQVGTLFETLKWNQPAYLTLQSGTGTTIRLNAVKLNAPKSECGLGLYFHCQTSLVETFRSRYGDQLVFEKNRAILLDVSKELPIEALRHCIALALTYHIKIPTG